jgi:hypothetical protein
MAAVLGGHPGSHQRWQEDRRAARAESGWAGGESEQSLSEEGQRGPLQPPVRRDAFNRAVSSFVICIVTIHPSDIASSPSKARLLCTGATSSMHVPPSTIAATSALRLRAAARQANVLHCRYPVDSETITHEALAVMRAAAADRERNRERARLAVCNVRFGVEALSAALDGGARLPAGRGLPSEAETRCRERWRAAIVKARPADPCSDSATRSTHSRRSKIRLAELWQHRSVAAQCQRCCWQDLQHAPFALQVVCRHRFIKRTVDFVGARRAGRAARARADDQPLGFMITNFNVLSLESASALELQLDWSHAFARVASRPAALLATLLGGAARCGACRLCRDVVLLLLMRLRQFACCSLEVQARVLEVSQSDRLEHIAEDKAAHHQRQIEAERAAAVVAAMKHGKPRAGYDGGAAGASTEVAWVVPWDGDVARARLGRSRKVVALQARSALLSRAPA